MIISDVAAVDPEYKSYRQAITLAASIQRRLAYYERNHEWELTEAHRDAARSCIEALELFSTRLVSNELISNTPPILRLSAKEALWQIFKGLPQPRPGQKTVMEQAVIDLMTEQGREQRAQGHEAMLALEIAYRATEGWYGVFNTLTVEDRFYREVFNGQSRAFRDYVSAVDRLAAQAAYGSVRIAKGAEYHTYFAVVEEGAKTGRLHIHVLHWLKALPKSWLDPNRAMPLPTRREVEPLKGLWRYGWSSPIMVRYSPTDAYGSAGFRWPYDTRTGKPLLVKSPLAIAGYMSKYVTKSYVSPKREKHLWRIRKSHGVGRNLLRRLLSPLTPAQLLAVADNLTLNVRINNQWLPHRKLRQEALRLYRSPVTIGPCRSLVALAKGITPLPSPLQSLRASRRTTTASSPPSSGTTLAHGSKSMDTYDAALAALSKSARDITDAYIRPHCRSYGTTSVRDHIYISDTRHA